MAKNKKAPLVRDPYSPKPDTGLVCPEQGLTKQSFKDECDIHRIIRTYSDTGLITHHSQKPLHYGEQPDIDLHQTQTALANAKTLFENLDDDSRGHFVSVSDFINAISDPERQQELIEANILTTTGIEQQNAAQTESTPSQTEILTPPAELGEQSESALNAPKENIS